MENTIDHFNQKAEIVLKKNVEDGSDVDFYNHKAIMSLKRMQIIEEL